MHTVARTYCTTEGLDGLKVSVQVVGWIGNLEFVEDLVDEELDYEARMSQDTEFGDPKVRGPISDAGNYL